MLFVTVAFYSSPRKIMNSTVTHYTRFFFVSNLGFCLELGLLNFETEIGTGVA